MDGGLHSLSVCRVPGDIERPCSRARWGGLVFGGMEATRGRPGGLWSSCSVRVSCRVVDCFNLRLLLLLLLVPLRPLLLAAS